LSSLLLYYLEKKAYRFISETYYETATSIKTYEYWLWRFKSNDFDLKDKEHSGQTKKFEDAESQALLDKNFARMLEELTEALNVDKSTVSNRLYTIQKKRFKKKVNGFHELSEWAFQNCLIMYTLLLSHHKKIQFCMKF